MKKTIQASLLLLAAAAVLGAYLLISSRTPKRAPGPNDRDWKPTLIVPDGAKLEQIIFVRPDLKVVFHYRDTEKVWEITQPVATIPEPHFSDMFVNDLYHMKREKIVEILPKDLAQYQLDQPSAKITLTLDSRPPDLVLLIGKINYNHTHYFAKIEADPTVFLIPASFKLYLEAPFDAFRAKTLMYHDPSELLGFEIKIEDPELKASHPLALEPSLVVQESEKTPVWVIVKPVNETADFNSIRGFFHRIQNPSSEHVVDITDENRASLGFDHPRLSVTYHCRDGSEEQTLIGGPANEPGAFYARSSLRPEAVVISGDVIDFIANSHFRNGTILDPSRRLSLDKIELEFPRQPENNLTIISEGRGLYHFADDPQQKVLQRKLSFLLQPFRIPASISRHFEPFPLKAQDLDPPALRIKLYENDALTLDLSLGNAVDLGDRTATFCLDNLRHVDFMIAQDVLSAIPLTRTDLAATPEDLQRARKIANRRLKDKEGPPP